jgi:hypothetical protein
MVRVCECLDADLHCTFPLPNVLRAIFLLIDLNIGETGQRLMIKPTGWKKRNHSWYNIIKNAESWWRCGAEVTVVCGKRIRAVIDAIWG